MRLAALALALFTIGCAASPPQAAAEAPWPAERPDAALQAAVEDLARGFRGRVGVYVRHLPTGRSAALGADSLFPSASMIKVPILVATAEAVHRGDLAWDQSLVFRDSLRYDDHGIVGLLRDSARIELHVAVETMLSASDNNSSLWLQALAGGGTRINEILAARGYTGTRMNSRTEGRRADWERYGWGQTTPREMTRLMREIVDRDVDVVSPGADEEMHRALTRAYLGRRSARGDSARRAGREQARRRFGLALRGALRPRALRPICVHRHHRRSRRPELGGWQRGLRDHPRILAFVLGALRAREPLAPRL